MPIWSAETREIQKLFESFRGQFPDLEKELQPIITSEDSNVVLLYSRRCLEVIVTVLCDVELKRPRKTEPLKGIIDKLNSEEIVPANIISSMHSLNSMSTFGTHPKDFDQEQVKPVLNNLAIIIKWYLRYKDFQFGGNSTSEEGKYENNIKDISSIKTPIAPLPLNNNVSTEECNKPRNKKIFTRITLIMIGLVTIILCIVGVRLIYLQKRQQHAKYEIIPQIQKMIEDKGTAPYEAFELATEAQKYLPHDSILKNLWPIVSDTISLQTHPEGAHVFCKDYNKPQDPWRIIGITPIKNIRIPRGLKRIKIEKDGYQTINLTSFSLVGPWPDRFIKLDSIGVLPENMIRVPERISPRANLGRVKFAGKRVGEFLIDKFEVTNKEYKQFIDSGGYDNKNYWNYQIYNEGREISLELAMKIFVDKTGKKGPAQWEMGSYPEGQENHPVTGISWYEASAYAAYAGKKLPTIYHWSVIAETFYSMYIIPLSNFNGKSTVPVGSMEGVSSYGIYDLAGNAREWCFNVNENNGENFIVGGGWNDPTYSFNGSGTQPAIDRSLSNGFRCMKELPGDTSISSLSGSITQSFDNYYKEKPIDDNTFNIFLRQYSYDNTPLNAKVITIAETSIWKIEKVTLDAAYNKERFDVYLFIPRGTRPPYQPVILFWGANGIYYNEFKYSYLNHMDFIVKSGRVIVFPVLKGTFERKDELENDLQEETVFYKDHVIMWRKDIGRAIDYIETRNDILSDKIGYYGVSWGAFMGGLIPAVEKRIKVLVLNSGGIDRNKALPEADQKNFIPRVYQPVLMLNGKYDMYYPVETSQKPMINLLGSPKKDTKSLLYDTGHSVPRYELIKETLAWYDKYLGPVK